MSGESMGLIGSILGNGPKKQSLDHHKTILGIAILSKFRVHNPYVLLQQIIEEQNSQGYTIDEHVTTHVIPVGTSADHTEYDIWRIARLFPDHDAGDIITKAVEKPFQAPDGNFGKYYLIFK
jgi:hypothetical protein